jgi:ATP-dependent Clp protease adaptor protein ClpS
MCWRPSPNDDHNTFDRVARTLSTFIPWISLSKEYAIADSIHNTGQAIV